MNSIQNRGRILGFLFVLTTGLGIYSLSLRGLGSSLTGSEDFLNRILSQTASMKLSIMVDVLVHIVGISLALYMQPILKKVASCIPTAYLVAWITQMVAALMADFGHWSLISLAEKASPGELGELAWLGKIYVDQYFFGHFVSLLIYAMGAILLYYSLMRLKLVPAILSIWGMVAVSVVMVATLLQIFDQDVSFYLYMQNGIFIISFTLWLLIRGFKEEPGILE